MTRLTSVEELIDAAARRLLLQLPDSGLSGKLVEFLVFGLKQAWACLFGGLFLGLVLITGFVWPEHAAITRYDFLFGAALLIQILMLVLKLEQPAEALVILAFHIVGTVMEVFKTAHGSWAYPEASLFHIGGVPMFSGFMYAAVGSYIARATRIFDFYYTGYPRFWGCAALAVAVYINFFSHHYIWDFRYVLFAASALLFWRCHVHYRVFRFRHQMPMILGFILVALFIWIAENLATWSKVWLYPQQRHVWSMVSVEKFGSWYLLMIISFVLVNLIHKPRTLPAAYK
ncbi:DUF817 domain-containing protein [Aestuariivirga litoralis]|uniref:DUF817 domain-containing protein n=1 Tax=Aestuariivirga litoralis TaxID=2650924 RepID=UPI0018C75049|nr:DUF817 domain-containing protein [Aestuariivirga litoralis]MBG1232754.1 DUF817 domain-containing protein [Aestuariivirga litoralis]